MPDRDVLSDRPERPVVYTAEMWGDGSYGVVDVRPRIPRRVGAAASRTDAERIARKMNEQYAVNERLRETPFYRSCACVPLQAENEHLRAGVSWVRGMCSDEEPYAEIDHMLGEILAGSPLPTDDKQPAPPEGLSVGRAQECEHCYQDGRCLSEPCPRPPKYPRGYDEDADREWDEWEALKATLPSPRQEVRRRRHEPSLRPRGMREGHRHRARPSARLAQRDAVRGPVQ